MTLKRRFNIENLPCEKRDLEWFVWADPCSGSSKAGSEDEADWVVWCSMVFIILSRCPDMSLCAPNVIVGN